MSIGTSDDEEDEDYLPSCNSQAGESSETETEENNTVMLSQKTLLSMRKNWINFSVCAVNVDML